MTRWMCGVSLKERRLGVDAIGDVMRRGRLRWLGHVERKAQCRLCEDFKVYTPGRLRPKEMDGLRTA